VRLASKSEAIGSQYDAMEKPQSHPTRPICFAALEHHVEFTVWISSIDGRAPYSLLPTGTYLLRYLLL
jgi:hypothetical protein